MIDKKHDAFRYDFTPREFLFFLFGKKRRDPHAAVPWNA